MVGHLDSQNSYDFSVSFDCGKCGHQHEDIEFTIYRNYRPDTAELNCEKCGHYITVDLDGQQE